MTGIQKIWFVLGLSATLLLAGCGENTAARDTAEAVIGSMFESKASSPDELAVMQGMPEYRQVVDCLADHLEQSGWTQAQHDFLMVETKNTGNIQLLDSSKFSEAEQIKHFGPIFTNSCL